MSHKNLQAIFSATVLILFFQISAAQTSSWVEYRSAEDTVKAYLAIPEGTGPFPAVIVIHEWWGLNDWIKQNADDFAKRGYVALAIDLYRGHVAASSDEAHELSRGLPEDRAVTDLKSAFAFLTNHPNVKKEKIGAIGWCMGGSYSLAAATHLGELGAAVICYGRLITDDSEIEKINCPVLGVFGETDRGIPASSVKTFERKAQSLEKDVRVTVYPKVGHAFMNVNNKSGYDEKTTGEAWQRIHAFLDSKLKSRK